MRALGVIQARGSSKRLPRKNVKLLAGKPLIAHIIEAARASRLTRVVVSTEDAEIAEIARRCGADVPFVRPDHLAADYAADEDILRHALDFCRDEEGEDYEVLVKLHPTTPFILPQTINACLDTLAATDCGCCFTARTVSEPPQWMFVREASDEVRLLLGGSLAGDAAHTQLVDRPLFPTGGAYAIRVSAFRAQNQVFATPLRVVTMDALRSVDIDDALDFALAEIVARELGIASQPV